jgi:hypothetical protein
MAFGSISVDKITDSEGSVFSPSSALFRNRIINGDMRIDQRNAGASVTINSNQYTLDRYQAIQTQAGKYSVQQSTTAPTGFTNSMLITSASAYSVLSTDEFYFRQSIEGYNVSDLAFGTASAKTVTLSFWVRSSLTGTFGGALKNDAGDRAYPFTYTISSADTWEQKSVTIAGDTTGTWNTGNGRGLQVIFGLGVGANFSGTAGAWAGANYSSATGATSVVGTSGATLYITGLQFEVGSVATPFERRPFGAELALCQRYYYKISGTTGETFGSGYNESTTLAASHILFPTQMRTNPTALEQSGTAADYRVMHGGTATACSSVPIFITASNSGTRSRFTVASGLTAGQGSISGAAASGAYLAWSAEL